jgi:hypothetical protein
LRIQFADGEIGATADGRVEPHAKRGTPRSGRDDQGSLF